MAEGNDRRKANVALVAIAVAALVLAGAGLGVTLVSTARPAPPTPEERTFRLVIVGVDPMNMTAAEAVGLEEQHVFMPSTIVVNKGDTVTITLVNLDEHIHGLEIESYEDNANVTRLDAAQNGSVTFVADHAGVFLIKCNIPYVAAEGKCGEDHKKITGTFIVQGN